MPIVELLRNTFQQTCLIYIYVQHLSFKPFLHTLNISVGRQPYASPKPVSCRRLFRGLASSLLIAPPEVVLNLFCIERANKQTTSTTISKAPQLPFQCGFSSGYCWECVHSSQLHRALLRFQPIALNAIRQPFPPFDVGWHAPVRCFWLAGRKMGRGMQQMMGLPSRNQTWQWKIPYTQ